MRSPLSRHSSSSLHERQPCPQPAEGQGQVALTPRACRRLPTWHLAWQPKAPSASAHGAVGAAARGTRASKPTDGFVQIHGHAFCHREETHAIGGMTHQPLHAVAGNHLHLGVEHGLELGLLILVSPAAHTGIAPSLIGNESVFTISPSLVPTAYAAIDTVADETSSSMTRPPSRAVPDTLSPDQTTSSPPI